MTTPSTDWKEVIAPGEAELFEKLAAQLGALQSSLAQKNDGLKRGLHAKVNVITRATFEVKSDVPEHLRVGPFATAGKKYDAVVRFSNGGPIVQGDKKPDVRGMAVKLLGVGGKKIIPGMQDAQTQDFSAILSTSVPFPSPEAFIWFVIAARSPLTLLPKAFMKFGIGATLKLVKTLQAGLGAPVMQLHTNRYFTPLPIRLGAYAAKYSFTPVGAQNVKSTADNVGAELSTYLEGNDAKWDFQVQLFTDETNTPLEDHTRDWNGPWVTLGTLTIPKQSTGSAEGQKLSAWGEKLSFDPWHACEELRPLGAMMRARSPAYRVSTQARGASPEPTELP
ncbi:MAG: catalase [Archangium sp.]